MKIYAHTGDGPRTIIPVGDKFVVIERGGEDGRWFTFETREEMVAYVNGERVPLLTEDEVKELAK